MIDRFISLFFLIILITSCAAVTPRPAERETSFFLARYGKAWETAQSVLGKQSIPIASMDEAKGVIITKTITYSLGERAHNAVEEIAYRPEVFLGFYTQVRYAYTIQVIPSGETSTQIRVTATIEAYDKNITRKWHYCTSKNVVERSLLEKIRAGL